MRRERLVLVAKLPVVLLVEAAIAPPMLLATVVAGGAPEPLLRAQNAIRQRALRWLFPEYLQSPPGR